MQAGKRGRPFSGKPTRSSWLTIRLRADEHDQVIRAAVKRGQSVTGYARTLILRDSISTDSPPSS